MIAKLKRLQDRESGFTLVEILIVVIIIGVLAAIAIPMFFNHQRSSVASTVKSDVRHTVSNVAVQLVKNPDATAAELAASVATVRTDTNAITLSGAYDNYTIVGSNTTAFGGTAPTFAEVKAGTITTKSGFAYESASGKYYGLGHVK